MTVSINPPKTPVTEGSSGIAAATVPNVCKMPGPPAPFVPTPLPNIGKSDNSPQGNSTSVTIEGKAVAIQGATFNSMGDVASQGTGGGLVSNNVQGPTSFVGPGSMDVKIEGKNVQLLGDQMTNNGGPSGSPANAATMPGEMQAPGVPVIPLSDQLQAIADKCNADVNKANTPSYVPPAKPKGKECTTLGTKKHTCCKKAIDDAKKNGSMSNDVEAEKCFTKGAPPVGGQPASYPGEIRPDVVLMKGGTVVDVFDFKFNCKKKPKMSSSQRKSYKLTFGTDPAMIHAW